MQKLERDKVYFQCKSSTVRDSVKPEPVAEAHEMQWRAAPENSMAGAYNPYWQPPYNGGVPFYSGFGFGACGGQGMMMPPRMNHMDSGMGLKRKRDEDQEIRGSGEMSSSEFRRSERPSPDRPSCVSQLSKKKQEQNNDHSHHRVHRDDHYHKDESYYRDHSHQSNIHHHDHSHRSSSHHRDHSYRSSSHHRSESSNKQKLSSSSEAAPAPASSTRKEYYEPNATSVSSWKSTITTRAPASLAHDESSDDDDVNFKRKPSWYKSSPPATMERERDKESGWQNQSTQLRHIWLQEEVE